MRATRSKQIRRSAARFALAGQNNGMSIKSMARNARKQYKKLKSKQARQHFVMLLDQTLYDTQAATE